MNLKLADLQSLLYRLITTPTGVKEAAAHDDTLGGQGLEVLIVGNPRLTAAERLGIYANAYFYRLHDILKEDFPCTYTVLGDINFHNLITGYLIEYPPSEPSVLYAGRHLPRYLQTLRWPDGISPSQFPFLADLARLERVSIDVFHGPDAQILEQETLRAIPPDGWPSLGIRLHPAAQILDVESRVDTLMTTIKQGQPWEPPQRTPATILVWRQMAQVHYRSLEPGERAALRTAAAGADFASICTALANELEPSPGVNELTTILNRILSDWLRDGLLTTR
jgi:Putative DNA-binding domain